MLITCRKPRASRWTPYRAFITGGCPVVVLIRCGTPRTSSTSPLVRNVRSQCLHRASSMPSPCFVYPFTVLRQCLHRASSIPSPCFRPLLNRASPTRSPCSPTLVPRLVNSVSVLHLPLHRVLSTSLHCALFSSYQYVSRNSFVVLPVSTTPSDLLLSPRSPHQVYNPRTPAMYPSLTDNTIVFTALKYCASHARRRLQPLPTARIARTLTVRTP